MKIMHACTHSVFHFISIPCMTSLMKTSTSEFSVERPGYKRRTSWYQHTIIERLQRRITVLLIMPTIMCSLLIAAKGDHKKKKNHGNNLCMFASPFPHHFFNTESITYTAVNWTFILSQLPIFFKTLYTYITFTTCIYTVESFLIVGNNVYGLWKFCWFNGT